MVVFLVVGHLLMMVGVQQASMIGVAPELTKNSSLGVIKAAAVMLVSKPWTKRRPERRCWFNASIDNLEKHWWPNNKYPINLLSTEEWQEQETHDIQAKWPNLQFIFTNIEEIFSTTPKKISNLSNWGHDHDFHYRRMCIFKSYGFLKVPTIRDLDYVMYTDDDACLAEPIGVDVFQVMKENQIRYGFVQTFRDAPSVTTGLIEYAKEYNKKNNLEYRNPDLEQWVGRAMLHGLNTTNGILPYSFSTNLEWIDIHGYQDAKISALMKSIDENDYIFERRWGDAPIRFLLSYMFWTSTDVIKVCAEYYHSSWPMYKNRCPNGTKYLIKDAVLKHLKG